MCLTLVRKLEAVRLRPVAHLESSPDDSSTTETGETTSNMASTETSGSSSSSDGSTESDSAYPVLHRHQDRPVHHVLKRL